MNLRTITTAVAGTTTLVAALGVGYAVGRTDEPNPAPPGPGPVIQLANADLTQVTSCEDLLQSYIDRGLERVGPYGWDYAMVAYDMLDSTAMEGADMASPAEMPRTASGATTSRATNNESGTNVQEVGVDEPDVVKVAGSLLVRIQDSSLRVYDVSGEEPEQLASLSLGTTSDSPAEILLVDDRVVILQGGDYAAETHVTTVDLSDPTSPEILDTTTITGVLSAARLHGDVVRLVIGTPLPELDFDFPEGRFGTRSATKHNEQVVRESDLSDWLPTIDGDVAVDCESVAIPSGEAELGTTSVLAFDPAAPTERTTSAVATTAITSYFSADRFYLAVNPTWGPIMRDCWGPCVMPWNDSPSMPHNDGTTALYAFALDGTATTYVASGEVEGTIADRWSMDSVDGSLRVALGPSSETGNFNSVVTLREEGSDLIEDGRVDKLGEGEEIKSVRWFDDLAIVVTFRQTDPLYAIDLSDPSAPVLLGELKIPGFSEYLHPLGEQRLIGVGQDADLQGMTRGAQAALFDVTDLTNPRQLDVVRYPKQSQAGAATDPRQFTWLPDRRTVLTVITEGWSGRTGWVSVLSLADGEMSNTMVEVEYGSDVAQVRLVPLASGQVVLVTGEDVAFFDF